MIHGCRRRSSSVRDGQKLGLDSLFSREGDTGVLHGVSEAFALFVVVGVELDGWCGFCGEAVDCLYLCSRPDSMLGSLSVSLQ